MYAVHRAPRGYTLCAVPLGVRTQVLFPLLQGEHQEAGGGTGSVLPQWQEVPAGGLQRALGLHAGGDCDYPRRGLQ